MLNSIKSRFYTEAGFFIVQVLRIFDYSERSGWQEMLTLSLLLKNVLIHEKSFQACPPCPVL